MKPILNNTNTAGAKNRILQAQRAIKRLNSECWYYLSLKRENVLNRLYLLDAIIKKRQEIQEIKSHCLRYYNFNL